MHSTKVFILPFRLDNNTYTKQTSASETFNIRQKLHLFALHSYRKLNEIFHVLGARHLRHDKVALQHKRRHSEHEGTRNCLQSLN